MLFGVLIGYLFRNHDATRKTEKTISLTIFTMLFILGLSVGSNQGIVTHLYEYGTQAAVLAVFGLTGSILFSGIVWRLFFKKGGNE